MIRFVMFAMALFYVARPIEVRADLSLSNDAGTVQVSANSAGHYKIERKSTHWVFEGDIEQRAVPATQSGKDPVGTYNEIVFQASDQIHQYSIRLYLDSSSVLFSEKVSGIPANDVRFPVFKSYPQSLDSLSYLHQSFSPASFDLRGDAPWIFYDSSANSFILSPANHFMISNNFKTADGLSTGIESQVKEITNQFEYQSLLVFSDSINSAYEDWGKTLTKLSGKISPSNDADATLATLGYWTDNRASYYYNYVKSLGYAGTLEAVQNEFSDNGIHLGYIQLDSWWYQKGSANSGIYLYEPAPNYFNVGLKSFEDSVKVPLIVHARWIDPTSPYMQQYKMSHQVSIDPAYWEMIMAYLHDGGVETYEQDWLDDNALPRLDTITDGDLFLDEMSEKASKYGINLQYCMPLPRHFLQASKYNNVYSIRPSVDGFERTKWTQFLYGSRLATAVGVWPWADVFFSQDRENILLANLSAGIVGVGDKLNDGISASGDSNLPWCSKKLDCKPADFNQIHHVMRGDSVLVKPDTALVPTDSSYVTQAGSKLDTQTMIAAAYSYSSNHDVAAAYIYSYAPINSTTSSNIALDPKAFGISGESYTYDYFTQKGEVLQPGEVFSDSVTAQGSYYILVPRSRSGAFLLGDLNLFVSMGRQRIRAQSDSYTVSFSENEDKLTLTGYSTRGLPAVMQVNDVNVLSSSLNSQTGLFEVTLQKPDGFQDKKYEGVFKIL